MRTGDVLMTGHIFAMTACQTSGDSTPDLWVLSLVQSDRSVDGLAKCRSSLPVSPSAFPFPSPDFWPFPPEEDVLCPNSCERHDVIANKYICQANMSASHQVFPSHKLGNENHVPFFFCLFLFLSCLKFLWPYHVFTFSVCMSKRSLGMWREGRHSFSGRLPLSWVMDPVLENEIKQCNRWLLTMIRNSRLLASGLKGWKKG